MSFLAIIMLVLLAVIILGVLFATFHLFIWLLPAIVVIAVIIWLINFFTNDKDDTGSNSAASGINWSSNHAGHRQRKQARDAHSKDVDR